VHQNYFGASHQKPFDFWPWRLVFTNTKPLNFSSSVVCSYVQVKKELLAARKQKIIGAKRMEGDLHIQGD